MQTTISTLARQWRHVDPDAEHAVGVRVDVRGDGELDVAGVDAMNASGENCLDDRLHRGVRQVDGKTTQLKQATRMSLLENYF